MIDVVFKIGGKMKWSPDHTELKYAIRSVCKNFKDLRNVVIVGVKPDWFTGLHLPCDDPFKKNKDANLINKLLLVSQHPDISENFVNISDDQLIIFPLGANLLRAYTINSDLRRMEKSRGISSYGQRVKNTINILKSQNLPCNLYECHVPMLINKEKYIEIMGKYDFSFRKGVVGNTIYFNNLGNNGEYPVENVRGFIRRAVTTSQIISECRGKLFLGYQRRALNKNLKEYLKQKFPEKSIYEK